MKKIELFGTELLVNDNLCMEDPNAQYKFNPSLRLYIKITDSCNANCDFCANMGCEDFGKIDLEKLRYVITYLREKNNLSNISITGGEPMSNPKLLEKLIRVIWEVSPDIRIAISTNGYKLREFAYFDQINELESIHISRHHYSDEENNKIFKSNLVAQSDDIVFLQSKLDDKKIININTMVMKGYIDNLEEIKKMLNHVGRLGVYKDGFVSLMQINDYSKKHFINFNDIFNNLDDNFFIGHHFYNKCYCECLDGMYITDVNDIVEFYARMVKDCDCEYTNQLVYTSNNQVTAGFGKQLILK